MSDKLKEKLAVVATIDPDANATGAINSDYINMEYFSEVNFYLLTGILVTTGTVDFRIQESKSTTGSGLQTLTSGMYTITQLDTDSNDSQVLVNVADTALTDLYTHIRGVLQITTAAADSAMIAIGSRARYQPASTFQLSSVAETKG